MINTKTTLAIVTIVAALTLVAATTVVNPAFAAQTEGKQGGPKAQNNFGDCQHDFNDNVCKKFFTGGG